MSDKWWCVQFGRQDGPMSLDALKAKLRDVDTREVFVWRDGFDDWKRVEDVAELTPPRPPQPPPFQAEAHKRKPIPSNTPSVKIAARSAGAAAALASVVVMLGIAGLLDASAALPQWSHKTVANFIIGFTVALAFGAYHGAKQYVERKRSDTHVQEQKRTLSKGRQFFYQRKIAISLAVVGAIAAPFVFQTFKENPYGKVWFPLTAEDRDRFTARLKQTNNCQTLEESIDEDMHERLIEGCRFVQKALEQKGAYYNAPSTPLYVALNAAVAAVALVVIFGLTYLLSALARRYWQWLKT
jgi:hypothetical protein